MPADDLVTGDPAAAPCRHAALGPGCCLVRGLRVTRTGAWEFAGDPRGGRSDPGRAFGGGLIAQALLAAGATVPDGLAPGSLHAYFVSPGDARTAMRYTVAALGAGRSSALRQVTAAQGGSTRLALIASFRRFGDEGTGHQRAAPGIGPPPGPPHHENQAHQRDHRHQPDQGDQANQPDPADPPGRAPRGRNAGGDRGAAPSGGCRCGRGDVTCGLALHPAEAPADPGAAPGAHRASWVRAEHDLGNVPLWHAAVLSYMSDIATNRTVDQPHRHEPGRRLAASVDHAVWFHRPLRADGWLWHGQRSPVYAGGRGICQGEFYDVAGRLVASCAQEVALRRTPAAPPGPA